MRIGYFEDRVGAMPLYDMPDWVRIWHPTEMCWRTSRKGEPGHRDGCASRGSSRRCVSWFFANNWDELSAKVWLAVSMLPQNVRGWLVFMFFRNNGFGLLQFDRLPRKEPWWIGRYEDMSRHLRRQLPKETLEQIARSVTPGDWRGNAPRIRMAAIRILRERLDTLTGQQEYFLERLTSHINDVNRLRISLATLAELETQIQQEIQP